MRFRYGKPNFSCAGLVRNQLMVDLGADICLAFPLPGSRGTWDCMGRAEAAGIKVINLGSKPGEPKPRRGATADLVILDEAARLVGESDDSRQ